LPHLLQNRVATDPGNLGRVRGFIGLEKSGSKINTRKSRKPEEIKQKEKWIRRYVKLKTD